MPKLKFKINGQVYRATVTAAYDKGITDREQAKSEGRSYRLRPSHRFYIHPSFEISVKAETLNIAEECYQQIEGYMKASGYADSGCDNVRNETGEVLDYAEVALSWFIPYRDVETKTDFMDAFREAVQAVRV